MESNQFPRRMETKSVLGTLFYVSTGKPVYGCIGLSYPKLQIIKKQLIARGEKKDNLIIHRYD